MLERRTERVWTLFFARIAAVSTCVAILLWAGTASAAFECSSTTVGEGCTVEYCIDAGTCEAFYRSSAGRFTCESCTDVGGCASAAARSCRGTSAPESGSSSSGGSSSAGGNCKPVNTIGSDKHYCEIEMCTVAYQDQCTTYLVVDGGTAQIKCPGCLEASNACYDEAARACLDILDEKDARDGSSAEDDSSGCSVSATASPIRGAFELALAGILAISWRRRRA
ncbi:MAG: hypothetical protein KIT84_14480 [Labilithrix sp.]|nr:hypothetical protein [Labilithrix sp.]MCW5812228.1 hypothetical protein [Labilithrix sp.]